MFRDILNVWLLEKHKMTVHFAISEASWFGLVF